MALLSGRNSLRDMVDKMSAQMHRLYHLDSTKLSRSNLSQINEEKPYVLHEVLFGKLLTRCQSVAPDHNIKFNHPLYSLDASTIDLCLPAFPWADFRTTEDLGNCYYSFKNSTIQQGSISNVFSALGETMKNRAL